MGEVRLPLADECRPQQTHWQGLVMTGKRNVHQGGADRKGIARTKLIFIENVLKDSVLSLCAKGVLISLVTIWRNNDRGQCNPGFDTIAKTLGLSRRKVIEAIAELKQAGWIEIVSTKGGSKYNTNRYKIDLTRTASDVAYQCTVCTGAPDSPVHRMSSTGAQNAHKPLLEPLAAFSGEGERDNSARRRAANAAPPRQEEETAWSEFSQLWQRGWPDDMVEVRKAFDRAVAAHGAEAILASARQWVAARQPRFLPEPIKFLSGAWKANPQPAGTGGNSGTYHARNKPSLAEAGANVYARQRAREGR
jgi:hypothetical protein